MTPSAGSSPDANGTPPGAPSSSSRRAATITYFQVVVLGLGLVTGILLARLLGPYGRGVFALVFVPVQLLVSLAGSASDGTLYFLSREPESRPQALNVMLSYLAVASVALLGLLGLLFVLAGGTLLRDVPFTAYAIATASVPFALWMILAQGYLLALDRVRESQIGILVERLIAAGGIGILWLAGAGLYPLVTLATLSITAASLVMTWRIGFRDVVMAARAPMERRRFAALLRYSRSIALANAAQKLTYRLDQLIINLVAGPATVGVYAVSARLAEVTLVLPRAFRLTWAVDRARRNDISASAAETLSGGRKLSALMLIALPLYGVLVVPLIPVLYGDAFGASAVPFVILLGGSFAISQSLAYVAALTGAGRPGTLAAVSWVSAAATIALDFALVPSFGATGAAIASLIAYATFAIGTLVMWHRLVEAPVPYAAHLPRSSDLRAVSHILRRQLRAAGERA